MTVSVIIPVYNEEKLIAQCLASLEKQSVKNIEIIVVDDGSTDSSKSIAKKFDITILKQHHKGPGNARNLGAKNAKGEILVFVDADMTFDKHFIRDLTKPIFEKTAIGTFSKNEMVANKNNRWSVCWNINRNVPKDRMLSESYPNEAPVYRAILKSEFDKVNGFETSGAYTDDWSLSEKLGQKSTIAPGAIYYHSNPSTAREVWLQARWIGKNKFLTGSAMRKVKSIFIYSLPMSLPIAIYKAILRRYPLFIFFKLLYDMAITFSVAESFFTKVKFR